MGGRVQGAWADGAVGDLGEEVVDHLLHAALASGRVHHHQSLVHIKMQHQMWSLHLKIHPASAKLLSLAGFEIFLVCLLFEICKYQ
jgi:hypothetical protein